MDKIINIKVEEDTQNERIDKYINSKVDELSRSYVKKLIEDSKVTLNGKTPKSQKVAIKAGDEIIISIPEPEELKVEGEDIPIEIFYEDEDVMIVNKEQGMVVHPAPGHYTGTLVNAILFRSDRLSSINGVVRPGIVHRIDKDTSGLLMIAKNNIAHNSLAKQLKNHTVNRIYYAVVKGRINTLKGTIDAPLGRHQKNRLKFTVTDKNAKNAITHFEVVESFKEHTLVKLKLETGRTHQIRVHMAYIGHPLVGDPLYGNGKNNYGLKGQALHARIIGFEHPRTNKYMEFESDLPIYFEELLRKLRLLEVR